MLDTLKLFFTTLLAFLLIDGIWLGLVAKNLYAQAMGSLMRATPNWYAAGGFYLLYCAGLVFLILTPALTQGLTPTQVAVRSFVFGVIAYATYDLTNLAVLKNWPIALSFIDMAWGGVLTALVCWIVFRLFQ